jgi:hypothetical protein
MDQPEAFLKYIKKRYPVILDGDQPSSHHHQQRQWRREQRQKWKRWWWKRQQLPEEEEARVQEGIGEHGTSGGTSSGAIGKASAAVLRAEQAMAALRDDQPGVHHGPPT